VSAGTWEKKSSGSRATDAGSSEWGHYFQFAPLQGTVLVHFTANHASVKLLGDGVAIPQQDNFLARSERAVTVRGSRPAAALFILIGAERHTDWLAATVQRDERGSC